MSIIQISWYQELTNKNACIQHQALCFFTSRFSLKTIIWSAECSRPGQPTDKSTSTVKNEKTFMLYSHKQSQEKKTNEGGQVLVESCHLGLEHQSGLGHHLPPLNRTLEPDSRLLNYLMVCWHVTRCIGGRCGLPGVEEGYSSEDSLNHPIQPYV